MNKNRSRNRNTAAKLAAAVLVVAAVMLNMVVPAFAGEPAAEPMTQITNGLNNLTTLLKSVVSAAGIIAVILSIVQLARAIPAHETTQISGAVLGIVAGMIMALNGPFLALLGL